MYNRLNYNIKAVATCHIGRVRENNEDNLLFNGTYLPIEHIGTSENLKMEFRTNTPEVVAVFDGMGGEANGELASYTAVRTFFENLDPGRVDKEYLYKLFNNVNHLLCDKAKEQRINQMGTTVSAVFFKDEKAIISNIGDSPVFLIRNGQIHRVFEAHTDEKMLKASNIQRRPALTQFLGLNQDGMMLEPYYIELPIVPGDIFLVSSDGMTDMIRDEEILDIANSKVDIQDKLDQLLNKVLDRGGVDNTTIILLEVISESKLGLGNQAAEAELQLKKNRKYHIATTVFLCFLMGVVMFIGGRLSVSGGEVEVRDNNRPGHDQTISDKRIEMPEVRDMTWQDAVKTLNTEQITYRIKFQKLSAGKKRKKKTDIVEDYSDVVINQSVEEGTYIGKNETVILTVGEKVEKTDEE